ncbi:hypothetical protein C3K47_19325 [Solitalea longa]|uniref:Uncharacterized protein n=1 Tax=Solitalea longa TaxID=2079460 RepID=A0A2S4ZXA9_9SPHI|nr:hypothetical protein [Solitalea longa]POY34627.1 hypothetical protein C3K47_19325 [Solitalea longa]
MEKQKFDMSKTDRIIFYSLMIVFPVLFVLFFLLQAIFDKESSSDVFLKNAASENFNGKVDSLYFEKQNHNVKIALLNNDYKFQIYRLWEAKIKVGDSLSKNKGSLQIEVFKKDKSKLILDYR